MRNTKKVKNNRKKVKNNRKKKKSIKKNHKKIVTSKKAGAISMDCSRFENDSLGIYNIKYNRRDKTDHLYYIDVELYKFDANGNPKLKSTLPGVPMEMAQWLFTDDKINNFNSVFNREDTPMDCVINAIQLIGILNEKEANLLRLSCASKLGMDLETLIKLFTYTVHHVDGNEYFNHIPGVDYSNYYLCDFAKVYPVSCYAEWSMEISTYLKPGHIMFAGWQQINAAHVFCFAKTLDGIVYYLDPQVSDYPLPCGSYGGKCEEYIWNGHTPDRMYFILYTSVTPIPEIHKKGLLEGLGFKLS